MKIEILLPDKAKVANSDVRFLKISESYQPMLVDKASSGKWFWRKLY